MKGGKQPGAGRPKGSTTKPQLRDHLTEKDIADLIAVAKKKAKAGDTNMLKFILEQIYGKAPQAIDLNPDGKPLIITFSKAFDGTP